MIVSLLLYNSSSSLGNIPNITPYWQIDLLISIASLLGIIGLVKSIGAMYIYDIISNYLPFVSNNSESGKKEQTQELGLSGDLTGEATNKQSQGNQNQEQSLDLEDVSGDIEAEQSQSDDDNSNTNSESENNQPKTDGGFDIGTNDNIFPDGGSQTQDQDITINDERQIEINVNQPQENRETDLSIHIFPLRNNNPPIVEKARRDKSIPIFEGMAQVQLSIKWPSGIECHWINIDTPDNYGVEFKEEDHRLCDYNNEDGQPPQFRINEGATGVEFMIEITADNKPYQHWLSFETEAGEQYTEWELCNSKRYEV